LALARILPTFQSTRPRGARQAIDSANLAFEQVSIHAPARGATCAFGILYCL